MSNPIEEIMKKFSDHYNGPTKPQVVEAKKVVEEVLNLATEMERVHGIAKMRTVMEIVIAAVGTRDDLRRTLADSTLHEPEVCLFLDGLACGLEYTLGTIGKSEINARVEKFMRGCGDPTCDFCSKTGRAKAPAPTPENPT